MYTIWKRTCYVIVPIIRSFVLPRPRWRRRRGLLKVPSIVAVKGTEKVHVIGDHLLFIPWEGREGRMIGGFWESHGFQREQGGTSVVVNRV